MLSPRAVWVFSDIFSHERDGGGGLTDGAREGEMMGKREEAAPPLK